MRILIVDDEPRMAGSLVEYLKGDGVEAFAAGSGEEGRRLLGEEYFDALVTDLRMPGMDGMALLAWAREERPDLPVIMISAHGELRDAVEAMRQGAQDYLAKPFDPDELLLRLRKAVGEGRSRDLLEAGRRGQGAASGLVGASASLLEALRLVERAAPTPSTVLITGESGTGKELVARLVHDRSGREGAFVAVNVGALPESLIESELFGHEKGAFTGAQARRIGLFETARRGTLFLDEIAELPLHLQSKLLRAIQDRKVFRVGSSEPVPVDARLVAATNRDLEAEVAGGRFRQDLYYRLNVIRLRLPPLRERRGDIPLLASHFLARLSTSLGRRMEGLSPAALAILEAYPFPGNVRELENAIERALILAEGPLLEPRDFPFELPLPGGGAAAGPGEAAEEEGQARSLAELEKEAVRGALARNRFHRERTAAELGITRRTLLNKIREYGIPVPGGGAD